MTTRSTSFSRATLTFVATALAGCPTPSNGPDASRTDVTTTDVPRSDVPSSDTSQPDVRPVDVVDASDASPPADHTAPDVVTADASDAAIPTDVVDAGVPDAAPWDGGCGVSSAVADHIAAMATTGWSARNASAGLLMYGCAAGAAARDCFASVPTGDTSPAAGVHLRPLFTSSDSAPYWLRVSPDGRFAARAGTIHDFVRGVDISGGSVDPSFFPDNSRFVFPGLTCPMSVLTTGSPTSISGGEPGCSNDGPGLYEHLAVALDGNDYWATSDGSAAWDDGGHSGPTLNDPPPNSPWTASAAADLTLMANTGPSFTVVSSVGVPIPYQGDAVISPSSQWLMTRRVDAGQHQTSYVLYELHATHSPGGAIQTSLREIAEYCTVGAKPVFSLDERWMATHHYVTADDAVDLGFTGPADPAFAAYLTQGAANIYLHDLRTGRRTRITSSAPGQYALFPTFRSDGWIYFETRSPASSDQTIVATDAALVLGS